MKKPSLKNYSDEELRKELDRRKKRRKGPILGYRVIFPGDEYNYGTYSDYMIGNKKWDAENKKWIILDKKTAEIWANNAGRIVEEIYKDTPKPERIS
jgi:hypothetical protein